MSPDLIKIFEEFNIQHFKGELSLPVLRWNSRLRSSAGRFIPGGRRFFSAKPAIIEVASYLLEELDGVERVRDTIGHEMIHYWLWSRRRPYGHTDEFYAKMNIMGVSRYNTVPRRRPIKYMYLCPVCSREFPARKRIRAAACADCCKIHSGGRYDPRFKLTLKPTL